MLPAPRVTIIVDDETSLPASAATRTDFPEAIDDGSAAASSSSPSGGGAFDSTADRTTMPTTRANSVSTIPEGGFGAAAPTSDDIEEMSPSIDKNPFDAVFCDATTPPPLIPSPHPDSPPAPSASLHEDETRETSESLCKVPSLADVKETVVCIVTYAAPAIGTQLGIYLIIMTSLAFVGNLLDVTSISGFAFACLMNDVCVYAVASGFSAATDTLCSQTFGKNPDSPMMVVYVVRSLALALCISVVLSVITALSLEDLMLVTSQPTDVAAASGVVVRILLAAVVPSVVFECLIRYLQAKQQQLVPAVCMLAACATHPLTTWLLTTHFGLEGAAWAFVISNSLATIFLLAYMIVTGDPLFRRWKSPRRPVFESRGMWRTVKLGVPGFVTTVSELAIFDYCTIVAGWLGVSDQAAQTIVFSIEELVFMIPFGLGAAAAAVVGNKVGEGDALGAKRLAIAFIVATALVSTTVGALMMSLRYQLPAIFTDDREVIDAAAESLLIAGPFQLPDGFVGVALGIARAVGAQEYGNWSFLLVFYPITLTLSTVLPRFTALRGQGIWLGLVAGQVATALVMVYALSMKADWTTFVDDEVVSDDEDDDGDRSPENALRESEARDADEEAQPSPRTIQVEVVLSGGDE